MKRLIYKKDVAKEVADWKIKSKDQEENEKMIT